MRRYFYISNDLDDLEKVELALEGEGISRAQIHVLSNDDAGVKEHNLNQVYSWFRTDVISTTYKGVIVGVILATIALFTANAMGATETVGWAPFIMLAIVCVGFCTWEGGLIGSHLPSSRFKKFQDRIENGQHVLMIDADKADVELIDSVVARIRGVDAVGSDATKDQWTIATEKRFRQFANWGP
jgi:hypothetical protein